MRNFLGTVAVAVPAAVLIAMLIDRILNRLDTRHRVHLHTEDPGEDGTGARIGDAEARIRLLVLGDHVCGRRPAMFDVLDEKEDVTVQFYTLWTAGGHFVAARTVKNREGKVGVLVEAGHTFSLTIQSPIRDMP